MLDAKADSCTGHLSNFMLPLNNHQNLFSQHFFFPEQRHKDSMNPACFQTYNQQIN